MVYYLRFRGAQTKSFLQGQLTQDLSRVTPNSPQLTGYCNPKGRLHGIFHLFEHEGDYYWGIPEDEAVAQHCFTQIKKVAPFSRVQVECVPDLPFPVDPALTEAATPDALIERFRQKRAFITAQSIELFLPHHVHLIELGAVQFDKGCYVGQEIIARMHYKGHIKKHLHYVIFPEILNLIPGQSYPHPQTQAPIELVNSLIHHNQTHSLAIVEDTPL